MAKDTETLVRLLKEYHLHISCAESFTGGLIASEIISVPGASEILDSSFITYSAKEKERLLDIDYGIVTRYGVVSREVAKAMASGLRKANGCDIALASTGAAGPDSDGDVPVGTAFLACAINNSCVVRKYRFTGTRNQIRAAAVPEAIRLALDVLTGNYVK